MLLTADIIDKKAIFLNEADLNLLLGYVRENENIGDIQWNENDLSLKNNPEKCFLVKQIEKQISVNNANFRQFPSELAHCSICLSCHEIKSFHVGDFILSEFKVLKSYYEPNEDTLFATKGSVYTSILCVNAKKRQLVLCHAGLAVWSSFWDAKGQIVDNYAGILYKKIIHQQSLCYEKTKEAYDLARDMQFTLSFTGYSNGAALAEYSMLFSEIHFRDRYAQAFNPATKAVLFDGPGVIRDESDLRIHTRNHEIDVTLDDLNIVNFLTSPKFFNSCNLHVGKIFWLKTQADHHQASWFHSESKLLRKIFESLKNLTAVKRYTFFFNGLNSIFNYNDLKEMHSKFDHVTGKPKSNECLQVLNWPMLDLAIGKR